MRITRRGLQVALGALWLFDGLLQLQPYMFSRGFVSGILAPVNQGQPAVVAAPLHLMASLVSAHPALANSSFALTQILLGLGILTRRFNRVALSASVLWALSVWFFGEGLGGLATGATLLAGAPGAALLYAVIALLAWPSREGSSRERPSWLALPAWCVLWLGGAVLQLIAGNNSASSLTMMMSSAQSGAPGLVARLDHHLATWRLPTYIAAGVVALYVLIAFWALVPGWTRQLSLGLGVVLSLTGWVLFQGLGDLTSGHATDPNTGPLIVLLAVTVVGAYPRATVRGSLDGSALEGRTTKEVLAGTHS